MPQHWAYTWRFQFHSSTIKTYYKVKTGDKINHFNSIVVQLKLLGSRDYRSVQQQFQFHNGTIKTLFFYFASHPAEISIP